MKELYHSPYEINGNNKRNSNKEKIYVSKYHNSNTINNEFSNFYDFSGCVNQDEKHKELELFKSLQREQIRNYGFLATYILKTHNTLDKVYGESIGSTYKYKFNLPMLAEDPSGIMQGTDSLAPYGYNMADNTVLYASYDVVQNEIKKFNIKDRNGCPQVGDLISFNTVAGVGNIMEITYIEDKSFLYRGYWTIYKFFCEVYNQGTETFDTGDETFDFLNNFDEHHTYDGITGEMDNDELRTESRERVIQEPNIWNLNLQKDIKYK